MMRSFVRSISVLGLSAILVAAPIHGEDAAVSEARLAESAKFLSDDAREGRGVGTAGLNQAADRIADDFRKLGLKMDLFDGTPFQKFTITVKTELGPREKNTLVLVGPPAEGKTEPNRIALELEKTFTPLATGGSGEVSAPLVFVGYGITDKQHKFDEYAGLDVKDKVVLLIRKEPQQADPKSVFNGDKPSEHATFMRKIANASEHGAKAVILVNDNFDIEKKLLSDRKAWREEAAKFVEVKGTLPESEAAEQFAKIADELSKLADSIATRSKRMTQGYDELLQFTGAGEGSGKRNMPVWFCLRSALDPVLKQAYGKDLAAIEREIDADLKPISKELAGWTVQGQADLKQQQAEIKNVIASLEGEGPLAEETIVIGAHYDHVGMGGAGSLAPWTVAVHNGADDNASGTAALLETATRLVKEAGDKKPRRRIVFMAFTGEERGLLGSAYYCRHPRFPLEKTIAMLNMDMVGRMVDDKLIVYGTGTAAEFEPMVNELGTKLGFKITKHEGGFGPSDHASFYAEKIPVLHLFTGNHNDYHRPSDDFEKLNLAGMRRVVDMIVDVTNRLENADARPSYREVKKVEHIADSSSGDRPYFGSIPDYSQEGAEGLPLMGVADNGPAAQAGLQKGDVIVHLGESKVTGIEDFAGALSKYKAGDRVKVKVKRADKTLELEVKLGKRPG